VVADQTGVPTSNQFIAEQMKTIILHLTESNTGIYHLVPDGSSS
jgi:dTDP-4-dehydrorhamnose reductase